MVTLGEKIKELRENLNMTQEDLAEGICTRSYISIIEKNQMKPSREVITKLSNRLGFDLKKFQEKFYPASPYQEQLNLIETLIYNQDYTEAAKEFNKIPKDVELPPAEYAKWLWEKAVLDALSNKKWNEGLAWCQEAFNHLEDSAEYILLAKIYNLMGTFYFHSGKLNEAYQAFAMGIQEMSKSPSPAIRYLISLYVNTAMIHNLWKEPHSAIIYLQKAKELNKKVKAFFHSGDIEFQWGWSERQLGNLKESKKHYEFAIQLFLFHEETLNLGAAYTNLGIVERLLGDLKASLGLLQKAVNHYKETNHTEKEINSTYELALTLIKLERGQEALRHCLSMVKRLTEESPLIPKVCWLIGEVQINDNNFSLAEEELIRGYTLVKEDSGSLEIKQQLLKSLIKLYKKMDNPEKRETYLNLLLETI